MATTRKRIWRYVRGLAAPVLLWALFAAVLVRPLQIWFRGAEWNDEWTMREWIEEARVWRDTLREMAADYLQAAEKAQADPANVQLALKAEKLRENLRTMGLAPNQYSAQLPSFPVIYRLELRFNPASGPAPPPIVWDAEIPRHTNQYRELVHPLSPGVEMRVQYQLHAYNTQQRIERASAARIRWIGALTLCGTVAALIWVFLIQQRERERERQRLRAQQQINQAEHRRLEEELRRRDAEQRQEETERKLLEQRLATQAAEGNTLELKSQLYASIGIMAGSYAHNIKNLLVRPNDLLRRCLEVDGLSPTQEHMLHEVRQTLGTVTERLQQILRTVHRDPSRSEMISLDLNELVRDLRRTWEDLAREKWKVELTTELGPEPLWITGDLSHLEQAIENLLFNARDATFEMRNHLRDEARGRANLTAERRRQALIDAAAWRGKIVLRTHRDGDHAVLEVRDNGIGMTEDVRRHCTETHFSTKRDNAVYEGNTTGMGLGLSFVVVILEHHRASLDIESQPLHGARFRVRFVLAEPRGSASRG
jgi:signal transduction histidine kinase